ncbi:WD40-repeat-containing domain protein [Lineolata rhizophorae]|uniref:WD40-repeat-containing domain protein n=1 Tax=Lineolata rhizophorae TaxID=578093 RepID=A0A6A6NZR8_9PEZI|nr:WD40-repeat-containing domain protein [Lineolata rhizophorae]
MYGAHRGMVPAAPNNRLNELLDHVRAEFDQENARATDFERSLTLQIQEMEQVRQKVYQLEQQQIAIKNKYEEEITRLQRELEARGGPSGSHAMAHGPPAQPPPPSIGHGPSNLFGGIMSGNAAGGAGGAGGQAGQHPSLAPPPPEPQPASGLPTHLSAAQHGAAMGPAGAAPGPGPAGPAPAQAGPGGPPQHPFGGYGQGPANGFGPQGPQPTASPGPKRGARGPPGPATPQQHPAVPLPGSPQVPRPTPPPNAQQALMGPGARPPPPPTAGGPNVGNCLAELEPDQVSDAFKTDGSDWYVVYNPQIRRSLDVKLLHTLPHASVVCCVRFSHDGRFIATGCNRAAQIFDVESGAPVAHLQDPSLPEDGDLYIRSVCFSPDGRYLATGAEDKIIRVWDISMGSIKTSFTGHEQDIYSLDFARNGRLIASGSGDRTVRLWDVDTSQQIMQLSIEDGVTTVAISPDNRLVAAGSLDKSVRVWDTASGFLAERLEGEQGHRDSVYSVAFAPNGRDLVSGSLDKTIKMWEMGGATRVGAPKGGKCVRTFEGHKDFVLSVALTPDGEWVLSGSKDRGVQFWDPRTGIAQLMLQGHKNSVISVAPSPSGKLFATGSGDMRARIWRYVDHPKPV